jgi:glycine betaine/proline transport system ATP-binding protein
MEEELRKTIIFITHDLDEALKMGDRIVLMKDGRVVQVGTPEEILTQPANEYVSNFVENVDVTKVLTAGDIMQPVDTVAYLKDGPRTALHKMGRAGLSGLFVVSRDGLHRGYVSVDALEQAVERNGEETVEDVLDSHPPLSVGVNTPIREVFHLMHDVRSPLPVVDDENRLKGVIVRGAVISGLATRGSMEGGADVD